VAQLAAIAKDKNNSEPVTNKCCLNNLCSCQCCKKVYNFTINLCDMAVAKENLKHPVSCSHLVQKDQKQQSTCVAQQKITIKLCSSENMEKL